MSAGLKYLLMVIVAVLALAGGYWLSQQNHPGSQAPVDTAARGPVDFTLPQLDGPDRALRDWRGRVVVVNFWATWCPPCREEIPMLVQLQRQRGAEGLQILGVAIDTPDNVRAFHQAVAMNYPILMGGDAGIDLMQNFGNISGSLPYTVIVDRDGSITARKLGQLHRAELEQMLAPLLGKSAK